MRPIDADALYPKIKEYFGKYLADEGVISKEEWLILKHNKNISKIIKEAPTVENYKDLEEQGLLLRLPCKVGDTVWFNTYKRGERMGVQPHKVEEVRVRVLIERGYAEPYTELPDYEFGKTVFLTREEAEAKLKELKEMEGNA